MAGRRDIGRATTVDTVQKNNDAALEHFDKAIQLNPGYFEFYVYRGLLHGEAVRARKRQNGSEIDGGVVS